MPLCCPAPLSLWKSFRAQAERGSGIGLKLFGFIAESVFTFIPEPCSGSPGMTFGIIPESAFTFVRNPHSPLMLSLSATFAFPSQIVLPGQSATPGASILGEVTFASQGSSVSGVQFDVQYDDSALSLGATLAPPVSTSNKTLYAVDLAPNKKRFLIIGLNQSLIPDGTLINLVVNINPSAPVGAYVLDLSNVCATDPAGNATPVAGIDGTVLVNTATVVLLQPSGVLSAGSFLPGAMAPGERSHCSAQGSVRLLRNNQVVCDQPRARRYERAFRWHGSATALCRLESDQCNRALRCLGKNRYPTDDHGSRQDDRRSHSGRRGNGARHLHAEFHWSGAGAILNEGLERDPPSNPAVKGTVISIFASGAGQTNPPGVDGQVAGTRLPVPLLPVTVQIGGLNAKVFYADAAPGLISGVTQVNALIPAGVNPGSTIPVVLTVGGAGSQAGVTIAIQ